MSLTLIEEVEAQLEAKRVEVGEAKTLQKELDLLVDDTLDIEIMMWSGTIETRSIRPTPEIRQAITDCLRVALSDQLRSLKETK